MVEDENAGIKTTLVQERKQLDDLMERNEELVVGKQSVLHSDGRASR